LIGTYAIGNQYASERTQATDDDFNKLTQAVWNGTNNLITRSKTEHRSRFMMEIWYKPDFNGLIGSLDERIKLTKKDNSLLDDDEQLAIRNVQDISLSLEEICDKVSLLKDNIEKIIIIKDPDLEVKNIDDLKSILGEDKVTIELR
jgi:CRISPR-associated protein Csh2